MDAVLRTFSASPAVRQEVKPLLYLLLFHLDSCSCVSLVFQCGCIQTAFMWMTTCAVFCVAAYWRCNPGSGPVVETRPQDLHPAGSRIWWKPRPQHLLHQYVLICLLHVTCVLTTLCSCLFMNLLFVQVKSHCPGSWQQRSKQLKTNQRTFLPSFIVRYSQPADMKAEGFI